MPNAANSLPVTRVSSAHTTSAELSASSARCGISPRLPMGVGHMISFPDMNVPFTKMMEKMVSRFALF